jgi:hypothetical protein
MAVLCGVEKSDLTDFRPAGSEHWLKVKNPDSPAMVRAREHFARFGQ